MKKPKSLYMHTIDGRPAFFDSCGDRGGGQVFLALEGQAVRRLESSLRAIRRNIEITEASRREIGLNFESFRYGYVRIPLSSIPPIDEAGE